MSSMEALSRRLVALTKANVADLEDLLKGAVKAHQRRLKDGRVIQVREAQRKDQGPRQGYKKPEGLSTHADHLFEVLSGGRHTHTGAREAVQDRHGKRVSKKAFQAAVDELAQKGMVRERGGKMSLRHGDMVRNPKGGPTAPMHEARRKKVAERRAAKEAETKAAAEAAKPKRSRKKAGPPVDPGAATERFPRRRRARTEG